MTPVEMRDINHEWLDKLMMLANDVHDHAVSTSQTLYEAADEVRELDTVDDLALEHALYAAPREEKVRDMIDHEYLPLADIITQRLFH